MRYKFALWIALALFTARTESARAEGYVYLGGAYSLADCQIIAGRYGYAVATFGGFVNGIYYWNACFGSGIGGGGGGIGVTGKAWYRLFLFDGEDRRQCRDKVHAQVPSASCRLDGNSLFPRLVCSALQADEWRLQRVSCVENVVGPFNREPR